MSLALFMRSVLTVQDASAKRCLHVSAILNKTQSGRYRQKPKIIQPLTYEMANPPHYIAARKAWNSWNTSNLKDGKRPSETAIEDMFIRNFVEGTWHGLCMSEIIIKRQYNMIRIAVIIARRLPPNKIYFLIGYTEHLLSCWLHCLVKMELQTVISKQNVIYKVI